MSINGFCPRCGLVKISVENLAGHDTWYCDSCDDPVGVRVRRWFHFLLALFARPGGPLRGA